MKLIKGGGAKPKKPLAECPRCGGREFLQTRIGAEYDKGIKGGAKAWVCLGCLLKGQRVSI